ncbi:hypothetical protein [Protaetiibacter larvae]|uniref:Uncharacterized protein n=1 Tax=Protaetiibacter larvae TaxID=2592654 RepID=A0A5C1YCP4_9MICO|nr:hypothetical protein [Protaetiibacter larvae]QEO10647.1 hypothetical protein FLP23_11910 [Protaetiibacter larvae]
MIDAPRFELPGRWGRIDLSTDASILRSIRKILSEVTHRRDDLAELRAELRGRFEKAAAEAKRGGATDFYVALSLTPRVPLPAWLAVFVLSVESTDFAALGLQDLERFLLAETRSWGPDGSGGSRPVVADPEALQAVRYSWRRVRDVVEAGVERSFEFIEADYWLAARDPNRIALLTFSTALAEYEEEMLALFDAVVSTIRWPAPVTATAGG